MPKRPQYTRGKFDKPWFGLACKIAQKNTTEQEILFYYHHINNYTKQNLDFFSKQYKLTINQFINKYRKDKTNKLRKMQTKNPTDYWKYIKSLDRKSDTIYPSLNSLYEHI